MDKSILWFVALFSSVVGIDVSNMTYQDKMDAYSEVLLKKAVARLGIEESAHRNTCECEYKKMQFKSSSRYSIVS